MSCRKCVVIDTHHAPVSRRIGTLIVQPIQFPILNYQNVPEIYYKKSLNLNRKFLTEKSIFVKIKKILWSKEVLEHRRKLNRMFSFHIYSNVDLYWKNTSVLVRIIMEFIITISELQTDDMPTDWLSANWPWNWKSLKNEKH